MLRVITTTLVTQVLLTSAALAQATTAPGTAAPGTTAPAADAGFDPLWLLLLLALAAAAVWYVKEVARQPVLSCMLRARHSARLLRLLG